VKILQLIIFLKHQVTKAFKNENITFTKVINFHEMCIHHRGNNDNKSNAYMETTLQGEKQLPTHSQDYIKSKPSSRN